MQILCEFISQPESSAEENVCRFIGHCREHCIASGMSWDILSWPSVKFSKLGSPNVARGVVAPENMLSHNIIEFARAYFWYIGTRNPNIRISSHYLAIRAIEKALLELGSSDQIWDCSLPILDHASILIREHYSGGAPYSIGVMLQKIGEFLAVHRLTKANLNGWKSPIRREARSNTKLGKEAEASRSKKLPDDEALDAIAEIFASDPQLPRDRLATSFIAMSMCAPQRASEILALPVSAEVVLKDRDGIERYGWRFFSNKGFEGDIKWVPNTIVEIAREAFKRIKELTQPARDFARWIELHPDQFYRHAGCPNVPEDEPLSMEDAVRALGFDPASRMRAWTLLDYRGLKPEDGFHTLRSLWQYVLARLPDSFPWLDKEKKIRFSEALFCTLRNLAHATRTTVPVELQVLTPGFFTADLGPREGVKYHNGLFDRHGYVGADGHPLKITTHQPRHLLNTIAQRAGMSQEYIAKWSGRANIAQNRTYNHTTDEENLAKIREDIVSSCAPVVKGLVTKSASPATDNDFLGIVSPAVHITEYGYCVHDFIISPCMKYRDCVNCSEQICVKGDEAKLARLKIRLERLQLTLARALEENEDTIIGADRWITHHQMTIERVSQMIVLLTAPDLPDGSMIRLTGRNYSHMQRALAYAPAQLVKEAEHGETSLRR